MEREVPSAVKQLLIGLIDETGAAVSLDVVKGKFILIYFGAQWCGPCRAFTPSLAAFQKRYEAEVKVVFCSLDNDRQSMLNYMKGKPWPAVTADSNYLSDKFGVSMIPTLVVVSPEGKYITDWGRSAITKNEEGCIDEWKKGESGVSVLQLMQFWK